MADINPTIITLAQLVAYVVLTATSIFVASVAAIITSRNANGLKPILLIRYMTYSEGKKDGVFVHFAFEIWNRRKYPVVARRMKVQFHGVRLEEIVDEGIERQSGWLAYRSSSASKEGEVVLEPNSHAQFSFKARLIQEGTFDDLVSSSAKVGVLLFDPKKNARFVIEGDSRTMQKSDMDFL